jgi:hypothetical protein
MKLNKNGFGNNLLISEVQILENKIFQERKIEYLDIFDLYFEMMNQGEEVFGFDVEECEFRDLGKIKALKI